MVVAQDPLRNGVSKPGERGLDFNAAIQVHRALDLLVVMKRHPRKWTSSSSLAI